MADASFHLANEFASVRLDIDTSALGPRVSITDLSSGVAVFLDPLELECLAWVDHRDLGEIVRPEYRERIVAVLSAEASEGHLVVGLERMLREAATEE